MRKASKEKLTPTPEPERRLEPLVWRCRTLSNTALEQRKVAYDRGGVPLTCDQQHAELPDLTTALPDDAASHAPVVPDGRTRRERAFPAFFRRLKAGEKPGSPRFQGSNRWHSCPDQP